MNRSPAQRIRDTLPTCIKRRLGKSISIPICMFGILALLGACGSTERVVVEVPVEVPVEVVVEAPRCELRNFDGGRSFVVEAWGLPDANFDVGEPLRLQMRASAAAYVSVYYVSSSCKVTRLLNNRPVEATEIVDFPTPESGLVMTVKPPAGDEAFYFIATREPTDFLSGGTGGDILGQAVGVTGLDLSSAQFYRRLEDARGRINPDNWSARTLRTRVIGH